MGKVQVRRIGKYVTVQVIAAHAAEYDRQLCRMPLTEGTTNRFPVSRKQFSRSFISDTRK
jgi:hypothetical protein